MYKYDTLDDANKLAIDNFLTAGFTNAATVMA